MQDLFSISNTLINDAKLALAELKKGDYQKVRQLINILIAMDKLQLKLILASLPISEDKQLFFDIGQKAEEIYREALLAKNYLESGQFNKTKKLLRIIIALEKEVIKKERYYGDEVILISKVTAEAAVLLIIRYQIDPYVQYLGHQIDVQNYKLEHLGEYIKHEFGPIQHEFEDILEKLKFWGEKTVKKKIETKGEFVTKEKILKEYPALVSHPRPIPHVPKNEPWAYIFSDIFYFVLLGTFVYAFAMRNIPSYIKRKIQTRKIKRIYAILSARFNAKIETLRQQIKVLLEDLLRINSDMQTLKESVTALAGKSTPVQIRGIESRIEELERRLAALTERSTEVIESQARGLGTEMAQFVQSTTVVKG